MKESDGDKKRTPEKPFLTGAEIEEHDALIPKLNTGMPDIDDHIDGGIIAGSSVEIYGPQWAGKTLLCTQIGIINQSMGHVLWYDSDGTFREDTVREIAFRRGLDPESVLERFHVVRSLSKMNIDGLTDDLQKRLSTGQVYLIIIDSLSRTRSILKDTPHMIDLLRVFRMALADTDTDTTLVFTDRASVLLSGATEQERRARGNQKASDMIDFRLLIELVDEHKRRVVLKDSISFSEEEWTVSLGYGGLYSDDRSMRLQERSVKRYLRRLRNSKR